MTLTSLQVFATTFGVAMGLIYAFSGWSDPGKTEDLSKNPRVRNLLWLFGGAVGVLVADWKQFSGIDITPEVKAALLGAYAWGALPAAVLGPAGIAILIALTIRGRARHNPVFRGRAAELVLEYIQFGYRAYRTRFDKLEAAAQGAAAPDALGKVGQSIAPLMIASALPQARTDPTTREQLITQVLEAIENSVKLFVLGGDSPALRSNYMARVDHSGLNGVTPLFTDAALTTYAGFLILRRYRDGQRDAIAIPLEPPARDARTLPGAPLSAARVAACCVNTTKVKFGPGVPRKLQAQVKAFFTQADYASVLSLPLIRGQDVVGVVNVESSHIDVVGQGPDMVRRINEALGPFCLILGELVQ